MAFNISVSFNEPIIHATFTLPTGKVSDTVRDCRYIIQETVELLEVKSEPVYRIYDFGDANVPLIHLTMICAEESKSKFGSFSDPQVRGIVVSSDPALTETMRKLRSNYNLTDMAVFTTIEQAYDYARSQLRIDQFLRDTLDNAWLSSPYQVGADHNTTEQEE